MADLVSRVRQRIKSFRVFDTRTVYQWWEQDHLRRLLPLLDVDCVFDVGANTGQYATMLRTKANYTGRIISFEPIPEAAEAVRQVAANDPLWTVEELALSSADGTAVFNVMANSEFSSLSAPRHDETDRFAHANKVTRSVEVRTETLSTAHARLREKYGFNRPYLKLDTQGFDAHIVRASPQAAAEFVGLQSELAVRKLYDDSVDFRDALTLYENCGFTLSAFVPNNGAQFPTMLETDCIMHRRDLGDRLAALTMKP